MEQCKIYLSGAMTGLTFEESVKWRKRFIDAVSFGDYDYKKTPIFFNPPMFYDPNESYHKSEREAMEFDLYQLRKSDIVVVNFGSPNSIGTAMELILAKEYRIPVVAINKDNVDLHPWIKECITRSCDNMREAVTYVVDYFLW